MALPYATEDQLKILERKTKADLDKKTANINLTANTLDDMNALIASGAVNDGQLCYCKADKKLYVLKDGKWGEVGGGIPIVEGTKAELTEEEQSVGVIGKCTIPEAQNSNFILKTPDNNYIYINYYSTIYTAIVSIPDFGINISIYGAGTFIYFLNYNVSSCNFLSYTAKDEANKSISYSDFDISTKNVVYFTPVQFGNNHYTFMFCYSEEQGIEGYGIYHEFYKTHLLYIDTYSYTDNTLTIKLKEEELLNTKDLKLVSLFTKGGQLVNYKVYTDPSYNSDSILPCTKEDKGKVLQVDANGYPEWADVNSKTISLFGKHSILVPKDSADTNINLYIHNIVLKDSAETTTKKIYLTVQSTTNTPATTKELLQTLLGSTARYIRVSGYTPTNDVSAINWKGTFDTSNYDVRGTETLLTDFTVIEDSVVTLK